jgi:hypothetical protein
MVFQYDKNIETSVLWTFLYDQSVFVRVPNKKSPPNPEKFIEISSLSKVFLFFTLSLKKYVQT